MRCAILAVLTTLAMSACGGSRSPARADDLTVEVAAQDDVVHITLLSEEHCLSMKDEPLVRLNGEPAQVTVESYGGRGYDAVNLDRLCGDPAFAIPPAPDLSGVVEVELEVDGELLAFDVNGLMEAPVFEATGDLTNGGAATLYYRHGGGNSSFVGNVADLHRFVPNDGAGGGGTPLFEGEIEGEPIAGPGLDVVLPDDLCDWDGEWQVRMPTLELDVQPASSTTAPVSVRWWPGLVTFDGLQPAAGAPACEE